MNRTLVALVSSFLFLCAFSNVTAQQYNPVTQAEFRIIADSVSKGPACAVRNGEIAIRFFEHRVGYFTPRWVHMKNVCMVLSNDSISVSRFYRPAVRMKTIWDEHAESVDSLAFSQITFKADDSYRDLMKRVVGLGGFFVQLKEFKTATGRRPAYNLLTVSDENGEFFGLAFFDKPIAYQKISKSNKATLEALYKATFND